MRFTPEPSQCSPCGYERATSDPLENTLNSAIPSSRQSRLIRSLITGVSLSIATLPSFSQRLEIGPKPKVSAPATSEASLTLPDAPSALSSSSSSDTSLDDPQNQPPPQPGQPSTSVKSRRYGLGAHDSELASQMASTTDKFILPGQLAPKLTAGDKVELGLVHGISPYSVLGWLVSAGYSHVINSSPNYGVDKGAFGARLGSAALRGFTEETFSDSLMAPLLHEDPRYYKLGPGHNVAVRAAYAVSRAVITRTDDGRRAPNYSLVAGNLLAAGLTNAYYPDQNRGAGQTAKTFGAAMGGAAFSYVAAEFISGALEAVHLRPKGR